MKTYLNLGRSFDHRELADLPAYARLRQVIDDLAHEAEEREPRVTLEKWLEAFQDMALTAPYGDCCERCGQTAWPHAVERQGDWLNGTYRCASCRCEWTCGYDVMAPHLF